MEEVEGRKRKKERTVSKINRFQQIFGPALFLSLTGPTALPVTAAEVKAFRAEPLVVCRPKCQLPLPPPLPSSRTPPRLRVVKFYTWVLRTERVRERPAKQVQRLEARGVGGAQVLARRGHHVGQRARGR